MPPDDVACQPSCEERRHRALEIHLVLIAMHRDSRLAERQLPANRLAEWSAKSEGAGLGLSVIRLDTDLTPTSERIARSAALR